MGSGNTYILHKCPTCGEAICTDIRIHTCIQSNEGTVSGRVTQVVVTDTCTRDELIRQVMRDLSRYVHDGITTSEIFSVLQCNYGIVPGHCYDIVQQLMLELNMYCPDREHLYYVK